MKIKEKQIDKGGSVYTSLYVTKELVTIDKYVSRDWIFTNPSKTEGFTIILQ